jgi:uncharacterized membrane protein YjjB (DUF3815 family)
MVYFATLFFSLVMNIPKRIILVTSILGSIGYIIYYLFMDYNIMIGTIIAMIFISIGGEIGAILYKTPSLDIIFPAVIPLVPGIGLYKCILYLNNNNLNLFYKYAYQTIGIAIIIAAIIALIKSIFRVIPKKI